MNIRDGQQIIKDPDGSDFDSIELAIAEAKASARDLMAEKLVKGEELATAKRSK